MKIRVDPDLCIGSANCVNLAKGVFVLDEDEEIAEVADPHAASPEDIRRAARSCPTSAIIIQEDEE
jgi:ferredoxin